MLFDSDGVLVEPPPVETQSEAAGAAFRAVGVDEPDRRHVDAIANGVTTDELCAVYGLDPESFWEARERHDEDSQLVEFRDGTRVRRYDVTPVDEETFYGYVEMDLRAADATLLGTFDVPGLVVVPPMVYTGRENVHVTVLGEPEAMSELLERAPDEVGVEVTRVSEHQRRSETLAGRLTARQFEALEAARDAGYYEVPRRGDLATVATELECSESAASTLLRSAEAELVDAALRR